jgi:hypothetical protein
VSPARFRKTISRRQLLTTSFDPVEGSPKEPNERTNEGTEDEASERTNEGTYEGESSWDTGEEREGEKDTEEIREWEDFRKGREEASEVRRKGGRG